MDLFWFLNSSLWVRAGEVEFLPIGQYWTQVPTYRARGGGVSPTKLYGMKLRWEDDSPKENQGGKCMLGRQAQATQSLLTALYLWSILSSPDSLLRKSQFVGGEGGFSVPWIAVNSHSRLLSLNGTIPLSRGGFLDVFQLWKRWDVWILSGLALPVFMTVGSQVNSSSLGSK